MSGTIQTIGITGAGQMGHGIAHVCALAKYDVVLHDVDPKRLAWAMATIKTNLTKHGRSGRISAESVLGSMTRIHTANDLSELSGCDLVIESAPEDEEIKRQVYADLGAVLGPETLIATNTSSISITRLAAATDRPGKFIGMHFMNPVPIMKLVEIIPGFATTPETTQAIAEVTQRLGKTAVMAQDFPGFMVNRIMAPMLNEAIYALYEGVGTVEAIDSALVLGVNHPMGPLALADYVGLDICLANMTVLYEGLADQKYLPCPLLVKYVEAGRLGRKSGLGFYDYSTDPPTPMLAR